jgi:tetratricopeptide (TPR) repeat protein
MKSSLSKKKTVPGKGSVSPGRLVFFKIFAFILPLIFIILLEGVFRLVGYGDRLSLFVRNPAEGFEDYMIVNPSIGKKYFQKLEYTSPANDIFLKEKPVNTFRIFVMGSSVVYGFPHDRNLMFSRILHQRLADAYPETNIEVVNTSITAINSFTLLDYIDEMIGYEPDAILVYAGHNEFYGAFGIGSNEAMSRNYTLARMHINLMDYRFYQFIRNVMAGVAGKFAGRQAERTRGTLMKRIVADKDILLNSDAYLLTIERYRQNMGGILNKAGKNKVPVFLSELVSNVSGMKPFNSIATDTLEAAIDVYQQARLAESNQDYDAALALYYRAKDLDCLRFRASEDVNAIIRQLAGAHDAFMVPMLAHFQNQSPHKLIGNNLMTEHVHPNIEGSFLMADAFYKALVESGLLGEADPEVRSPAYYKRNWGYTDLDRLIAHHRVQLLKRHWPFVPEGEEDPDYFRRVKPGSSLDSLAIAVVKDSDLSLADVRLKLARRYEKAGMTSQAYREYEALLRMNPYVAVNYRDAASCLLQLSDLPLALSYMKKSLTYEDSFFAKFRIAEIYMIMGDFESAVRYFEEAYSIAPDDRKINVMGKFYAALVYAGNTSRAEAVAAELQRLQAIDYLRVPAKNYVFSEYIPFQTERQVNEAKQLIRQEMYDEALALLDSSLSVYDSHIANRLIGDIYFSRQDHDQASHYYNKVYELFRFDVRFLHNLFMIHMANNAFDNAGRYLQEIEDVDPNYPMLGVMKMMLPA